MNAAKALLEAKSATYVAHHGVTEATPHGPVRRKMSLSNLKVKIKQSGIVPSLSAYYREAETVRTHAMDDLFYNLPFIHRTFCLTYASLTDMFLPIKEDEFVRKKATGEIFFRAKFVSDISVRSVRNKLPQSVEMDPDCPNGIRSKARVIWAHATKPNAAHDSPHFQMAPKVSAKAGISASISANRSINGCNRTSGIVGINS